MGQIKVKDQLNTVEQVFARYEAVRHRLPHAVFPDEAREIDSLLQIADQGDAFVFDAFGVLNIGHTPIDGAAARLDQLRAQGCAIRLLSNAASHDHGRAVAKFRALGLTIAEDEVITSRDATLGCLNAGHLNAETHSAGTSSEKTWGCIAASDDDLSDIKTPVCRLKDVRADYDSVDGILFLSTEDWSLERQALLDASLSRRPRPVWIANADIVAPREDGFTLEPGHFGHLLADRGQGEVRFFGKPFPEACALVEASLSGIAPARIVMCGDTLHTDILGAAARGWRTVLVTGDGLFSGTDALGYCKAARCTPDWHLARI